MELLTLIVKKKKILVIIIDNALLFDSHINDEYKKATQKLFKKKKKKKKMIFNSMIKLKFTYCPLICDALRDLVPSVQFKKRGKHQWRSVTFSKVGG